MSALDAALPGRVSRDPALCASMAEDVAGPAPFPAVAVARPETPAEVAAVIAAARAEGLAVVPRGGGMSYTGGYAPPRAGCVTLDLRGLTDGLEVDAEARVAVVPAGMTWAALDAALAPRGLRARYLGPLSGVAATVGGALSQNGAFFGSASGGYAADGVLGLEVADGTGALRRVGSWAAGREAALPWFGPGLVAPFLGDAGALGVKTRAVLRLVPRGEERYASFAFDEVGALLAAQAGLGDVPGLAEVWAFDRETHRGLARTGFSVLEAASLASEVAGKAGIFGAARRLAEAATIRRAVLTDLAWSLHVVVETPAGLAGPLREAAAEVCRAAGGREIPDAISRVTRAKPFRAIKALVGPEGERWLPCHGVLPAARAPGAVAALEHWRAGVAAEMEAEGVRLSLLLASVGGEIIVEPQLHWPDALSGFQRANAQPAQVAAHDAAPARPAARALAHRLRGEMIGLLAGLGAGHLQIGRVYRYAADLEPGAMGVLRALKAELDPDGLLNPGALGL